MLLAFISAFIITVISFSLGFFLSLLLDKNDKFESVVEKVSTLKSEPPKVGLIDRPTAEEVRKRGTIEEETEEAMASELRKIFKKK